MKNLEFNFGPDGTKPMVLDVETQFLAEEVAGGWNSVEQFRVSVAVTWDEDNGLRVWQEEDIARLLEECSKFTRIVTFNGENFDIRVLSAYGDVKDLYARSFDLLSLLVNRLGHRVKLDSVAQATLGAGKSGIGTDAVAWWRSGDPELRQKVIDYCKKDVEITRDVYLFAKENGFVLYDNHGVSARAEIKA